ncbi:MAG: tetratricopeptide repeat protein [Flavobacteriales bacterium]|nr:tetratricopeptide repeat protein [Flavobacteriales bacterium]MCB9197625.1 tetratricopeptide repeat protein [Flavobacteriales bacterium]
MKKLWIFIAVVGSMSLGSCGSESNEISSDEQVSPSTEDLTVELDHIKKLNEDLMTADPIKAATAAQALFTASSEFVNNHPNHEKTPAVMEVAAKASEAMGKPQQAINILQKLVDEFPVTDETPKYLANIARIYEERLGDNAKAKETYDILIEKFPEDPLALEADNYVKNFLGKSEAEILMFLDSVQNAQH